MGVYMAMPKRRFRAFLFTISAAAALTACVPSTPAEPSEHMEREGDEVLPLEKTEIRAGIAKVKITPIEDFNISSYTTVLCKVPEDIRDDIYAQALVMESGQKRIVYVSAEIAFLIEGITVSGGFRSRIADAVGAHEDDVFLAATHNHQAPDKLTYREEQLIIDAAIEASKSLQSVKMGITTVPCPYGVSRSPSYNISYTAPYDNTLVLVRLDTYDDEPLGLIYSYPLHNTMIGNLYHENRNLLSCEFTGFASRYLEEQLKKQNPGAIVMFMTGLTGNSGPLYDGQYSLQYEEVKKAGQELGKFVHDAYNEIETKPLCGDISGSFSVIPLRINQDEQFVLQHGSGYKDMKIYCTALEDLAIVGVGAEVFNITGAHLRAEAPFRYVISTSSVNGWCGYLPTYETFHSGMHEEECQPYKTPFSDETEAVFYDALINELCALAGLKIDARTAAQMTDITHGDMSAVYEYEFQKTIKADKLVIDCGQASRADCPEDFTLQLMDDSGIVVFSQTYENNSVNYIGAFIDGIDFSKAKIIVATSYQSIKEIEALPISLYAIVFSPIQ